MSFKSIPVTEYKRYSMLLVEKTTSKWIVNLANNTGAYGYDNSPGNYNSQVFSGHRAGYKWKLTYNSGSSYNYAGYGSDHCVSLSLHSALASTNKKVYAEFSFTVNVNNGPDEAVPGGVIWFCDKFSSTPQYKFASSLAGQSLRSLTISVIINVQLDGLSSPLSDLQPSRLAVPSTATKYTEDMLSVFKNGKFSDIIILVGSKDFKCHKGILAGRSPYFQAMLNAGLSESTENIIQVTDFTADTIEDMITYLYTSRVKTSPLTVDSATELLRAADKYQILDMKDECEQFLKTNITSSSALDVLLCADLCSAEVLKKSVIDFICKNLKSFTAASQYEPLLARPHLLRDLLVSKAAFSSQ